jgi:hypothetical protein
MGLTEINFPALGDVEAETARRQRLAQMTASAGSVGSAGDMFGEVPNGARAAEALNRAIANVTQQVNEGGRAVEDIQNSAVRATQIGEQTDQETARVQRAALGEFNGILNSERQAQSRLAYAEGMS